MLQYVDSAMRRKPMTVPSRSATAMTMRVREPMGKRIAARVVFAVASALSKICVTSVALKPPMGPAAGVIKSPSGGGPVLLVGATRKLPVPPTGPAERLAGSDVWLTNGRATPPMKTTPGAAGVGPKVSVGDVRAVVDPENAANSATFRSLAEVT